MKKRYLYLCLVVMILGIAILKFFDRNYLDILEKNKRNIISLMEFKVSDEQDTLQDHTVKQSSSKGRYYLTADIGLDEFQQLNSDTYKLIINRAIANGYKVYLNGKLIDAVGDTEGSRSYIWLDINSFNIHKDMLNVQNELVLEMNSEYGVKIPDSVIITTIEIGNKIEGYIHGLFIDSYKVILGVFIGILLLIISVLFIAGNPKKEYLYLPLSGLFLSIYMLNFLVLYTLPFSLLNFKKLVYLSLYIAIAFIGIFISKRYKSRLALYAAYFSLAAVSLVTIIAKDIIYFKTIYTYINILIPVNLVIWIHCLLLDIRNNYEAKILTVEIGFVFVLSIFDLFSEILYPNKYMGMRDYGFILSFYFISLITPINYIENHNNVLQKAMEACKERDTLEKILIMDPLTLLYNHRFLYQYGEQKLREEPNKLFSFLFCDIDKFKIINDTFGHAAGDRILQNAAQIIKEETDNYGNAFRYGGEEFVAILENVAAKEAFDIAERIRMKIWSLDMLRKSDENRRITISIGISSYPKDGTDIKNLIHNADLAMYQAKESGRNKCCVYEENINR